MATPRASSRRGNVPPLPPLPTSYQIDFGREVSVRDSNRDAGRDSRTEPVSRLDVIEDRLLTQESKTQALLDRAYKIKEDIIENLNFTHGTWHDEKVARELLQDHIRTITDVVKKLGRDIQTIEVQLQERESATSGASNAVKNLEVHHVAGLTDLRGRVARCDAAITKLSTDLHDCFEAQRSLAAQSRDNSQRIVERLQHMDTKMTELTTRLERSHNESDLKLRHVEGDSSHQVQALDTRTKGLFEELRGHLNTQRSNSDMEREKLESRMLAQFERSFQVKDSRQEKYERKMEELLSNINQRMNALEQELIKERERSVFEKEGKSTKESESRFFSTLENSSKQQKDELSKLKRECREGFSTVHESISNMKQVMDGKRRLLEEQLRKELAQIRKMVVLI